MTCLAILKSQVPILLYLAIPAYWSRVALLVRFSTLTAVRTVPLRNMFFSETNILENNVLRRRIRLLNLTRSIAGLLEKPEIAEIFRLRIIVN